MYSGKESSADALGHSTLETEVDEFECDQLWCVDSVTSYLVYTSFIAGI